MTRRRIDAERAAATPAGPLQPGRVPREVGCPTCGRTVDWTARERWRPFCSERCKLIDLGEWLDEGHRIPGEPVDPGEDPQRD